MEEEGILFRLQLKILRSEESTGLGGKAVIIIPVYLPTSAIIPSAFNSVVAAGQQVKFYASAEEDILVRAYTQGIYSASIVKFYIIGYLEDAL